MERRLIVGIVILTLTLGLSIGTAWGMQAIHKPSEEVLTEAAQLAAEGNMPEAVSLGQEAFCRWQKFRGITAAFADHNPMDDTERLFREMIVYGQTGEAPHFAACCTQLSAMLKAIYETHGFSLKNIL